MSQVWEFYIAGAKFHQLDSVIEQMVEGEDLVLQPDPDNQYDSNAMKILRDPGQVMLGFVPKRISEEVTKEYRRCNNELGCIALRVTPDAPPWNKLMCRIWTA